MGWNTILVPFDFSESAEHACRIAAHEARAHGASIVLLHVVELMPHFGHEVTMMARPGTTTPISVRQYHMEEAETALRAVAAGVAADEIHTTIVVRCGVPVEEIGDYLRDHPIDAIVMGTHGRTGLRRMLVGSVAERIIRTSHVPVLTIRHPDRAPGPA
jgi:nucleotide-binding universal stress UspA family protein